MKLPNGLCLTGSERCNGTLQRRLTFTQAALHEVRLDCLGEVNDDTFACLAQQKDVLVCCRPPRQGGHFSGSETERLQLLRRAAKYARLVDVEADVPDDALAAIPSEKRVLSWHDFQRLPEDLEHRLKQMAERRPALLKVAVEVQDAAELLELRNIAMRCNGPLVAIGMGEAGLLSRTHFRRFGSPFCYVAASRETTTAPGQLDLQQAQDLDMPASSSQPLFALLGGRQIAHSPGPGTYNRWLRSQGRTASYVPVVTEDLGSTLRLLAELGLLGASVTMPLKRQAVAQSNPSELARRLGAANSIRPGKDGWESHNSDVTGVRVPLAAQVQAGQTALILGAGGAARAAAAACQELGLQVVMAARRQEQTRGFGVSVAWHDRSQVAHDVLINATPVTGEDSPWPTSPRAKVVFDLAIGSHSQLLADARNAGCTTLSATEMWLHQGLEQMHFFGEEQLDIHTLRRCLHEGSSAGDSTTAI